MTPKDQEAPYFCSDLGEATYSKNCEPYEKRTCGEHQRIPKCENCGSKLKPQYDRIAKKVTGYLWRCDCWPENIIVSIG